MRQLLLVSFLILFALTAYTQDVSIILEYGKDTEFGPDRTLIIGNHLLISLNKQLKQKDIQDFFSNTKISTTNAQNGEGLPLTSLKERIEKSGKTINDFSQTNNVKPFDLLLLTGVVKEGYTIVIHPFLGLDGNNKPFIPENKSIQVKVLPVKPEEPSEEFKKLSQKVDDSSKDINALKEKVSAQDKKIVTETNKSTDRLLAIQQSIESQIQFNSRPLEEQKRLQRALTKSSGVISSLPDFTDCPSCIDLIGDLIYDFRCKNLYEAISDGKTIQYRLVTDLSTIKVKAQNLVRFKVIGINRYLYAVNATIADSLFGSEPPTLFNQFFSGSSDLLTSLAEKGKAGLQGASLDPKQNDNINKDFEKFKEILSEFRKKYDTLLDLQTQAYLFCLDDQISCCGDKSIGPFSGYSKSLSDVLIQIGTLETTYLSEMPSSTKILSDINDAQAKIDACKKNEKKRADDIAAAKKEKADAQTEKEKATTDPAKKAADDKIKAADDKLKKLNEDGCDESTIKGLNDKIKSLKENLPLRISLDQIKTSLPALVELRKLYMFDRNIVKDHFLYRLPPIYPQGDKLKIVLDMQAIDTTITKQMGFMPTYHDELNLEFSVRNKALFSFSSGPFIAFGFRLPAPTYGFKQIPASGTVIGPQARYQLVPSGNGPLPIGLAGFAHLGTKFSRTFGMAATIGAGYTFNQESAMPAFLGGVSFCFGNRQRINLTFGLAGVQVKEVKENLYVGNIYESAPELEYNKPLRFGLFAGVTYSLFTSTSQINLFSKSK